MSNSVVRKLCTTEDTEEYGNSDENRGQIEDEKLDIKKSGPHYADR